MGLSYSSRGISNDRQGRTPEKQEGASKERSTSVDSTCSNRSVEHRHHMGIVGFEVREFNTPDGIITRPSLLIGKLCPVQPDGVPHYRSQQTRDNQPQPGGR